MGVGCRVSRLSTQKKVYLCGWVLSSCISNSTFCLFGVMAPKISQLGRDGMRHENPNTALRSLMRFAKLGLQAGLTALLLFAAGCSKEGGDDPSLVVYVVVD